MTAASYRALSAVVVAFVCGAGAALAWYVAQRADLAHAATVCALIAAGTGIVAALAVVLTRPQDRSAAPEQPPPAQPPLGGSPPPAWPTPAPRHAAAPTVTDGEVSGSSRVLALNPPDPPAPDPQTAALVAQQRNLLAKQGTLLRGLADLLVRLPDESAWQASRLLETAGAWRITPEPGTPFDPALHHVLDVEPTSSEGRGNTVAHTLRPGWRDQDQVLVPAHVVLYVAPDHAERELDDDRQ